jgi:hypothetical protein
MREEQTIKDFLMKMASQDNRCTRRPFFYVIRHPDYVQSDCSGDESDGLCDSSRTIHVSKDEPEVCYEADEIKERLMGETGLSGEEVDYAIEEGFREVRLVLIWRESGLFLTETDAEAHLKANHYHYGEGAHTYVKHAWRATELEGFIKALYSYFGISAEPPQSPITTEPT